MGCAWAAQNDQASPLVAPPFQVSEALGPAQKLSGELCGHLGTAAVVPGEASLAKGDSFLFMSQFQSASSFSSSSLPSSLGLLELEASLPPTITQPRMEAPKPRSLTTKDGFTKRSARLEMELAQVYQVIWVSCQALSALGT